MSDNKKYYYLKLKDNFYDSEQLIILQSMPDGYIYSDILMKLYLRSLKNKGKLMFNDMIPYTPQVLAQVVRHQVGTVEKALQIFKDLGLIEILDNGAIFMLDIQNYIGKSSTEADRIRDYRNVIKKEELSCTNVQLLNDKTTPEIEIEKEIEKEIKIETEIDENFTKVKKSYEENIGLVTPATAELLSDYLKDMDKDLIIKAIKIASINNKRSGRYVQGILNDWSKKGIKNLIDVENEEKEFKKKTNTQEETEEEKRKRKIKELEDYINANK